MVCEAARQCGDNLNRETLREALAAFEMCIRDSLNTIPIWKSQIVIALGLGKQQKVLKLNQEISETTNELLARNAQLLKINTVETAREAQRGVVDVETLKKTNQDLIETIRETLRIQQEGRKKRREAEAELTRLEDQLKEALTGKTESA